MMFEVCHVMATARQKTLDTELNFHKPHLCSYNQISFLVCAHFRLTKLADFLGKIICQLIPTLFFNNDMQAMSETKVDKEICDERH